MVRDPSLAASCRPLAGGVYLSRLAPWLGSAFHEFRGTVPEDHPHRDSCMRRVGPCCHPLLRRRTHTQSLSGQKRHGAPVPRLRHAYGFSFSRGGPPWCGPCEPTGRHARRGVALLCRRPPDRGCSVVRRSGEPFCFHYRHLANCRLACPASWKIRVGSI